jgi:hypothetical protein
MMTRAQFLLVKLAEEAAEVSQIALKSAQFGLSEVYDTGGKTPATNLERIHRELDDLMGVLQMLNTEFGFGYPDRVNSAACIEKKIRKVEFWYQYSVDLGAAEPV